MKTDYKNINKFEVAVVGMILVGFILIGVMLFTGLSPRRQQDVAQAVKMFDIHEQVADTVQNTMSDVEFIMDIPNQFYNQFYIAFTQVATLPAETFDIPASVAVELSRNITVAINNLSDQVAQGYSNQINNDAQVAQRMQVPVDVALENFSGQVLGASIAVGATSSKVDWDPTSYTTSTMATDTSYTYTSPDFTKIKFAITKLINQ